MEDFLDTDELDNDLKEMFDPQTEIKRVILGAPMYRIEFLCSVILDCGLRIACETDFAETNDDKFTVLKKCLTNWNFDGNAYLYTSRIIAASCACYRAYNLKDRELLAAKCFHLLKTLKKYDIYWTDKIFDAMEQIDVD